MVPRQQDPHLWLAKTPLLKAAFDDLYSDPETRQDRYQEALDLLRSDTSLDALSLLFNDGDSPLNDADRQSEITDGWVNYGDIEEYVRDSFDAAVSHAMERDVELAGVFVGSDIGDIEIGWFDNPSSVVVVIKVPLAFIFSKCPRPGPLGPDDWTGLKHNGKGG
jgi:hypothetical protein